MTSHRRGYTLIEFLIVLSIVGILAVILWPIHSHQKGNAEWANCLRNLKQVGLAFQQYAQDYDNRLVPVETVSVHSYGWADALHPYWYQTPNLLQCPAEATAGAGLAATQRGYTDYWMNANLSRVTMKNLSSPMVTILSGDGNDGTDNTNARYSLRTLPPAWLKARDSPARRHLRPNLTNILFADGHVKAVKAPTLAPGTPTEYGLLRWRP
jgi:prepilin-type N-terminal cleavage/methylation domain-containing protein/prepilin-type processing-associated H-X9-DG protein